LIFFPHCVELPAKNQLFWTTFETLAEIERDCKERQLCMGDCRETTRTTLQKRIYIYPKPWWTKQSCCFFLYI